MDYLKKGDVIYYKSHQGGITVARVKSETAKRVKAPTSRGGTATIKKEGEKDLFKDSLYFKEVGGEYRWWQRITPEIQKRIEEQGIEIPGPKNNPKV